MKPKEISQDDENVNELNEREGTEDTAIDEQIDQLAEIIIANILTEHNEETRS